MEENIKMINSVGDGIGSIVLYQTADGGTDLEVHLENGTVWLTKEQMACLFERDRSVISKHISNISKRCHVQ